MEKEFNYKEYCDAHGHHWLGEEPDPDSYFGFVYLVLNISNGKAYIGKKSYWGIRRKRIKNRKNRKVYRISNKWEFYTTSSKVINKEIEEKGIDDFIFIILENCSDKMDLSLKEIQWQLNFDVLKSLDENEEKVFYNNAIGNYKFSPPEEVSEKTRKKQSDMTKGKLNPNYGKSHTEEAKKLIGAASKLRGITEETRAKMLETKRKKTKIFEFEHENGDLFIGSIAEIAEFADSCTHTFSELVRGKTRDKTCVSGYANVLTRKGWKFNGLLGLREEIPTESMGLHKAKKGKKK